MKIALLIGEGNRVPAILKCVDNISEAEVVYVLSCKGNGIGTESAITSRIGAGILRLKDFEKTEKGREKFSRTTARILKECKADLVIMAGWMVIMPSSFVKQFRGRVINIHPSILPSYPGDGKKAIKAQWEARWDKDAPPAGCTLHYVDEGVDTGEPMLKGIVYPRDHRTLDEFAEAIHKKEEEVLCCGIKKLIAEPRS